MRRIGRDNTVGSDFAALLIRTDENCTKRKAVDADNISAPTIFSLYKPDEMCYTVCIHKPDSRIAG